MNLKPTVHIVDDNEAFRESLSLLLNVSGFECIAYKNAKDFIYSYVSSENECLILDMIMPEMNGNELFNYLKKINNPISTIFLSGHKDISMAVTAIKDGAMDFILKPFQSNELICSIDQALKKTYQIRLHQNNLNNLKNKIKKLTPKELKIFYLMRQRKTISDIANLLKRSESTIEKHRMSVLKKTEFNSTEEMNHYFEKNNIA